MAAEYLLGIVPKQTHDYQKFIKPSELLQWTQAGRIRVGDHERAGIQAFYWQGEFNL